MKDNLSIIISMLIFVILIIIFPLYNYFERQDDMSYNLALKATTNFVEEVVNAGYLDQDMYDRYVEELSATGNLYEIELEAHRKVLTKNPSDNSYNEQFLINYNSDIFTEVENPTNLSKKNIKDNAYYFNVGDQFYVKTKNSNTTMAGAIFNTIVPASDKQRIVVNYGGVIKNQAWAKVDALYKDKALAVSTAPVVTLMERGTTTVNQIVVGDMILYPTEEAFVFSAMGPNPTSWWNDIEKYNWYIDGSLVETLDKDDTFTFQRVLTTGETHILSVRGMDTVGNLTDPTDIKITVNENISGGTGGNDFDGTSLDVDIPRFINAYPKKITLDVYLSSRHAYSGDDFRLYNDTSNIMNISNVGSINGTYYFRKSTTNYVRISVSHSTSDTKFTNLSFGDITFSSVRGIRIRIILNFNYDNADLSDSDILKMFEGLAVYYENEHAPRCYLNANDDDNVLREGVYSYKIEYGTN